jgi:translocation and assembly module TamA
MNQTVLALVFAVTALGSLAHAADPQPYKVEFVSVGNSEIDSTLKATSDLLALRSTAPVSPFGLIARARSDVDRLTTALQSFGYYQCAVAIRINAMMVNNPGLGDLVTALPKGTDAQVSIGFTLGPLYHLGRIEIDGDVPETVRSALGLTTGQPAVASAVLAGGARMLAGMQDQGYAFATVDPPVAVENATQPVLDLSFHVVTGAKVNVGAIRFEGLQRMHEPLLRARLPVRSGDRYNASTLERARHDLLALGVFSQVSLAVGTAVDDSGGVPITFKVRERARHAISVSAAYSSDLGGSAGVSWTDRNVFGNADQLTLAASVIDLGGSDTTGTGYDTSAKYLIPDFGRRDQSIQFAVGAIKQSLQAYDQTARTTSVTLIRKLSSVWTVSVGGATTDEQIIQEDALGTMLDTRFYTLFALPMNVNYDATDLTSPLEEPRHGIRASLSLRPTLALGHPNARFLISQLKASTYFDLNHLLPTDPGRTVLALRGLAGRAEGAGEFSLPPDQRFYGGGSDTIRGYRYQSVGPQFPVTAEFPVLTPIGGTAITAGGAELRQRLRGEFGAVAFVDAGHVSAPITAQPGVAGQVSSALRAQSSEFRIGAGAGLRYYTPIGPIRLDVAVPIPRHIGDDALEVYIGLGPSF